MTNKTDHERDKAIEAARKLCAWIGYNFDGLPDGRLYKDFTPWAHNGIGQKIFQGHKEDVLDFLDALLAALPPDTRSEAAHAEVEAQYELLRAADHERIKERRAIASGYRSAEEECLAANQCHHGYGDDSGNHRCEYQDQIAELETRLKAEKERSAYYSEATNSACERLELMRDGGDSKIASYSVEPQIRRLNDQISALESQLAEAHRIIEGKLKYLSIEEAAECPGPLDCSLSYTVMIEDKKRLEALVLALQSQVARMRAAIVQSAGCFEAALIEGWLDALADGDMERIKDLWLRRISYARYPLDDTIAAIGPDPKDEKP